MRPNEPAITRRTAAAGWLKAGCRTVPSAMKSTILHLVHLSQAARHVLELSQDTGRMVDFIADGTFLQPAFNHPAAAVRRVIAGSFGLIERHRNRHRYILRVRSTLQLLPPVFALVA